MLSFVCTFPEITIIMKRFLVVVVSFFIFHSCFSQDVAKLNELMDLYAAQYKFNGSALVVHHGKTVLNKGYGLRNAADSSRNDPNSIFQIGSITKQFTSTVIMKLQEEKKMSVKDKLSKYFPDYPKGDSITVEQLLTHTSGIYNYTDDEAFMKNEVAKPSDRKKMMALFKDKPLLFSPGTKWDYSNSGYSLLGYIIEDVAHMPYEKAVRTYIFEKAGMAHSGFDFTYLASKYKATGYFNLNKEGNTPSPIVDSSVSYSAGAIYTTTADLYKWFQALQANTIISAASKKKAQTALMNKYGYGWGVDSLQGKKTVGHSGGIHGFNSDMKSVPEDSTTVILIVNVNSPHLDKIMQSIYAILYNMPFELPNEKTEIALPDDVLKQYVGVYDLNQQLIVHITFEDGKLMGKPEGQGTVQLRPEKTDLFFIKEIEAQVKFNRNENNEVISLTLNQNGQELTGKKR
jgi:CubicO group peptidase (beta-lactamase class C family)